MIYLFENNEKEYGEHRHLLMVEVYMLGLDNGHVVVVVVVAAAAAVVVAAVVVAGFVVAVVVVALDGNVNAAFYCFPKFYLFIFNL